MQGEMNFFTLMRWYDNIFFVVVVVVASYQMEKKDIFTTTTTTKKLSKRVYPFGKNSSHTYSGKNSFNFFRYAERDDLKKWDDLFPRIQISTVLFPPQNHCFFLEFLK